MGLGDDNVLEGLQQDEEDTGVYLFGRNISKIPCFKDSFLTGIYGGFGCGVLTFLATSKVIKASNVCVGSFALITLGYWFNCRIAWAKNNFIMQQSENSFAEEIETAKQKKTKN